MGRSLVSSTIGVLALLMTPAAPTLAQQVADVNFKPVVGEPAFPEGEGPRVVIDEGHHNFHTASGRYRAFADLLRRDGYVVEGLGGKFTRESLEKVKVLVIANALAEANVGNWSVPTPSAFTAEEIKAVTAWINRGGSLLLIADHMPMAGAAAELAAAFGLEFGNGFAFGPDGRGKMQFRKADGSLKDHPIVRGRNSSETIEFVTTFTGQAFRIRPGTAAKPLMIIGEGAILRLPATAWQFSDQTPQVSAAGMVQGAALRSGAGRVAAFGEAAMFTAQVSGPQRRPMGMNHPDAPHNPQFILNVLHWLSGPLADK